MSINGKAYIAGVYEHPTRKAVDKSLAQLHAESALGALADAGLTLPEFVQDNHSFSAARGTVRGLHYQAPPHGQGKLVRCARGRLSRRQARVHETDASA